MDLILANDEEGLKKLNQYNVSNAWFKVDFGGCPYGIFSAACPVEPLHALENGIISDCLKILIAKINSTSDLAELDELARSLTYLPRQEYASSGTNKDMPRLLWPDGISNMNDITAAAKVGRMFTIVALSWTEDGKNYFDRVFKSPRTTNDMRRSFEIILSY